MKYLLLFYAIGFTVLFYSQDETYDVQQRTVTHTCKCWRAFAQRPTKDLIFENCDSLSIFQYDGQLVIREHWVGCEK